MNPAQKLATCAFIAAIALTSYFAPWEITVETGTEAFPLSDVKAPLWEPPEAGPLQRVRLKPDVLIMEWAGVGVLYFLTLALCKTTKPTAALPKQGAVLAGDPPAVVTGRSGNALSPDQKAQLSTTAKPKEKMPAWLDTLLGAIAFVVLMYLLGLLGLFNKK
jgi:hypothetical protein